MNPPNLTAPIARFLPESVDLAPIARPLVAAGVEIPPPSPDTVPMPPAPSPAPPMPPEVPPSPAPGPGPEPLMPPEVPPPDVIEPALPDLPQPVHEPIRPVAWPRAQAVLLQPRA
jgi:hypothetical protein